MAFGADPYGRDAEIYTAQPNGTHLKQITDNCNAYERNPAWSPPGDRLAFDRAVGSGKPHIYVMRKDGSGTRRVTPITTSDTDPSWSPEGTQLVFTRGNQLFVIGTNGSGERQLTNTQGTNFGPAWSPRGDRIAFTNGEIYVMNPDGSGVTRLTNGGGTQPAWSSDGSRIAFTRDYNIWIMNAAGTNPRRLTARDGYTEALSSTWSPDGGEIAYSMDVDAARGSQYALDIVDATSGTEHAFIFENQDNLQPDWQRLP